MSMSRDGLLPKKFSKVHKKYKTPSFSTITTGFVVAISALLIPSDIILDLCSMGTLFAFVLVCAGVLKLQNDPEAIHGKFKTPYLNAKFIMPALSIISILLLYIYGQDWTTNFFTYGDWNSFKDKIPMWLFFGVCLIITVLSFMKHLSLIPVLGLVFCFYMMAQIQLSSWLGFLIWLIIGLGIYFSFGYKNSKLAEKVIK